MADRRGLVARPDRPGLLQGRRRRAGWRSSISTGSTGPGTSSGSTTDRLVDRSARSAQPGSIRSPGSRRTGSPGCPRRGPVPPDPAAERTARWLPLSDPTAGGPVRSGAAECSCDGRVVPSRRVPEDATPTGGANAGDAGPRRDATGPLGRPPAHQADDRVVGSTASRPTPLPWCTPPGMQPSGDKAETPSGHRVFRRTSRDLADGSEGLAEPVRGGPPGPALRLELDLQRVGAGSQAGRRADDRGRRDGLRPAGVDGQGERALA